MSKKLILGVLMICVVGALVGVATWAAFSDVETSTGNVFTAGTLDLQVDGLDDPIATYFEITNAAPGDTDEVSIVLKNAGSIDGIADIHLFLMMNDENTAWEPELAVGDVPDDPLNDWDGELAENLLLTIEADLNGDLDYETLVAQGSLAPGEGKLGGPPIEDILWGVTVVGDPAEYSEVFTVNAQTGVVTMVNSDPENPVYSDIAMTPNGFLYTVGQDNLYRLNADGSVARPWESVFTNEGFEHVNALAAESNTRLLAIEGPCVCDYEPPELPFIFQAAGTAIADWSKADAKFGDDSVELTTSATGDVAAVALMYPLGPTGTFGEITYLSFWYKDAAYADYSGPHMAMILDWDHDGAADRLAVTGCAVSSASWKEADCKNGVKDTDFYTTGTGNQIWWLSYYNPATQEHWGEGGPYTWEYLDTTPGWLHDSTVIAVSVHEGVVGAGAGAGSAYIDDITVNTAYPVELAELPCEPCPALQAPRLLRITLDDVGNPIAIDDLGGIGAGAWCSDGDLAMDPDTGKWYAGFWAEDGSEMVELNLTDPSSSQLVSPDPQSEIQWQGGLAFGIGDGARAYAGSRMDEKLYEVDIAAGGSTELHNLGADLGGPIFGLTSPERMRGIESLDWIIGLLKAGESINLKIGYLIPAWVGNIIMSDTLNFDIEFSLFQPMVPPCIEVIGIQQPDVIQPLETLTGIAVDVKNTGQQTGECTFDVVIALDDGTPVATILDVPTGEVGPLATAKVQVPGSWLVEEAWLGKTIIITATPDPECCGETLKPFICEIDVVGPATLVVTGIQQEPTIYIGGTLTVAVDVHNAGGKPGQGIAAVLVTNGTMTTLLAGPFYLPTGTVDPCETVKLPLTIGDVEESWTGLVLVIAGFDPQGADAFVCPFMVSEAPPAAGFSSTWDYNVNYSLGAAGGETISALVTEALTGGPVSITVKYQDQSGNLNNFATAVTIPANSPINTVVPITLAGGDTGVQDIQAATKSPNTALAKGTVAIVGNSSGILGGALDLKLTAAYFTDGMAFYILEDTVMTTHLLELVQVIPNMLEECTKVPVPLGPAKHAVIDPSMGGLLPPTRALPGTPYSMATISIDAWSNPTNGTGKYVYLQSMLLGIIPMEVEVGYHTYVKTGGTNIGQPYAVGNSWTYIAETDAYAAAACSGYSAVTFTVSVVAGNVSVTVPAGTFNDCFQITTNDPAPTAPGIKTDYWSPTVMGIVKTVNSETYFPGTETTVLTSYTIAP